MDRLEGLRTIRQRTEALRASVCDGLLALGGERYRGMADRVSGDADDLLATLDSKIAEIESGRCPADEIDDDLAIVVQAWDE